MNAVSIGFETCLGSLGSNDPDKPGGTNCFELVMDDKRAYKIVNFYVEDLEKLIAKGLTWPIKCREISERTAIIHDPRIGERWYRRSYCETCCPKVCLPITQLQAHERDVMRGRRKEGARFVTIDGSIKAEFE